MPRRRKRRSIFDKPKQRKVKKPKRLGKLEPLHKFFLNPNAHMRFSSCPLCHQRMRVRKKPFLVHIAPNILVMFNLTSNYCPDDDLIIVHKDQLEATLSATYLRQDPSVVGRDYTVLGTVEPACWQSYVEGKVSQKAMFANLHDFEATMRSEPAHFAWVPDEEDETMI